MPNRRTLVVGLVGYNFMGRAHSNAWRQAPRFLDLAADLRMKTICGRDRRKVRAAAVKLGWERAATDWRELIADDEIDVIDICTPNDSHAEIAIAAAQAGKAVLCEKPLARNLAEAERMLCAAKRARVPNMVCHNYRRVPAIGLARQMITGGEIGDGIYHFRARYAQDWITDPQFPAVWRLQSHIAGSGALGDIGAHIVDLARYLVGEIAEVSGNLQTFIARRGAKRVDVDDAVAAIGRFKSGAMLTLDATRFAHGRKNQLALEINGSAGSLAFDLERMNELQFYSAGDREEARGFRRILVTEPTHPFVGSWWPPGHLIGYEHTFVHTIADFVNAIVSRKRVRPDFADGVQNQRVLDAIERSAKTKRWIKVPR
jgi:predicted dehydrogenase